MRNKLINLLFRLLGNTYTQVYNIQYLFGASTQSHEARKKKWELALARMWKDKDLIDFLYYQCEADKENIFRGKISKELSQGARIRTLFLVYSARKAYNNQTRKKTDNPNEREEQDEDTRELQKVYNQMVDVQKD